MLSFLALIFIISTLYIYVWYILLVFFLYKWPITNVMNETLLRIENVEIIVINVRTTIVRTWSHLYFIVNALVNQSPCSPANHCNVQTAQGHDATLQVTSDDYYVNAQLPLRSGWVSPIVQTHRSWLLYRRPIHIGPGYSSDVMNGLNTPL